MGFDQYHEPPDELSEETHTEEFIHFAKDLEFLLKSFAWLLPRREVAKQEVYHAFCKRS